MGQSLHLEEKITKDEVYDLYIIQNKTYQEIANIYECSKSTIIRLIKNYCIVKDTKLRHLCSQNAIIKKYGVDNVFRLESIKEKSKQTILEKYGVDNVSKSDIIKEKKIQKAQEVYGVDNVFQSEEIKDKLRKTNMEKYGYYIATQNPDIRAKMKNTMKLKYGYEYPKQYNDIIANYFVDKDKAIEFIKNNNYVGISARELAYNVGISYVQILRYIRKYELQEYIHMKPGESSYEDIVVSYLKTLNIDNIIQHDREILDGHEIDIYLPDYKIGIEINGVYYHSEKFIEKKYHFNKSKAAEEKGIHLMHVYEDEILDEKQFEKIKSILKIFTHKIDNKIYARKCIVKKITNSEARDSGLLNILNN